MISVSECSNHCGPGVRTVTWRCVQILDSPPHSPRPVPAHACLHIEKPSEHQPCVGPCDDAHWSYSEWNACSVSCGGGVQLRSAICVDSNERQVRDENCAKQEKHLKRICSQEACPKWDLGEWSPVSKRKNKKGKKHYTQRYACNILFADQSVWKISLQMCKLIVEKIFFKKL